MLRISLAKSVLAVLVFLTTMVAVPGTAGAAPVTCGGVVFQDYDNDGERAEDYSFAIDTGSSSADYGIVPDPGVAGIAVTVTTASGAVEPATTDADGAWSVTVDDGDFPVRVEFSGLPSGWQAGPAGVDSGTLTQFVETAADCAGPFDGSGPDGNASVVAPGSFCENRPEFVTSCFLFGNVADHDNQPAIVAVLDGSKDNNAESNWQNPPYTQRATLGEVGTVWGTGVDRTTGDAYLGAFVKRHTRLAGNPTTIYRVTSGGSVAPWFTVDPSATDPHTAAQDAIDLGLADPLDGWIYDYGSFDDVGKAGLGDVEISLDGNTLYTIDLGNRDLVAVPIQSDGSPGTPTRTAITAAALGTACGNADVRPFGLGIDDDGLVHVGIVCSAESTVPEPFTPIGQNGPVLGDPSQLSAHVYTFDGSGFALETDVPLPTTTRGSQVSGGSIFAHQAQWRPWVDRMPYTPANIDSYGNTYPQPLVSGIAFDGDDMIIGLMDRWAHQTGANAFYEDWANPTQPNGGFASEQPISSGDLVRAVANGSGYDFPQSGADFFYNDFYQTTHLETNLGAAAQIPGRPYVVTAAFDPNPNANTWQSGGLEWFDNDSGDHVNGYRLYNGRAAGLDVGTFEKAAGVGDVEAFCGLPSIQIGNRVWFDTNGDGIQDAGEPSMDGVVIELLDAANAVIGTTTTDTSGEWYFDDVAAGADLKVRIAQVNYDAGGVFASGGTHDNRGAITVADAGTDDGDDSDAMIMDGLPSIMVNVNATDHTFDFGMVEAGTLRLGNRVWLDADGDGAQNGTEPGIGGVEVQLWTVNGAGAPDTLIATDTTDGSGFYLFESLYAGDYVVAIADSQQATGAALAGLGSTSGNGTAPDPDDDNDLDDNGDPAPGFASIAAPVTLTEGGEPPGEVDEGGWVDTDSNLTVDFGFVERLRLGNLVFEDLNADGDADAGEPGIADVTVQLWSVDGAGAPDTLLGTDITDGNGFYQFTDLEPGDYIVAISDGEQLADNELHRLRSTTGNGIAPDVDANPSDSDDNGEPATGFASITAPITLVGSTEPTGEIDEDGSYADDNSNLTVDLGFVRSFRLGNLVWFDADNDGVADAGESPIPGVQVQLWTADGAGAPVANVATETTDANGRYLFEDLPGGDYIVAISDGEQSAGQPLFGLVSSLGAGDIAPDPDNGVDNDDNGSVVTGFAAISTAITLDTAAPTGEIDGLAGGADEDGTYVDATSDLSVDFGFAGSLRLGNRVWLDADGNGAQNGTEPGIGGVEVQLWTVNGAGAPDTLIATDTTDGSGFYGFEYLAPGDYIVAIADSQQAAGQPLQGLGSTAGNGTGPDPDTNIDLDDNGDATAGFASITRPVTLAGGGEPAGEVDEVGWVDNDSNLTIDLGFTPGVEIGNLVWFDRNNNGVVDGGEAGVGGVTVNVVTPGGGLVASTVTAVDGSYVFTGVAPGDYIVEIPASQFAAGNPLAGWFPSNGAGVTTDPDDDIDDNSDGIRADAGSNAVRSGIVTVTAGTEPTDEVDESPSATADDASNLTVDFGFYQLSLGDLVWFDDNNNGIQDAGELPVVGVVLRLVDAATGAAVIGPDGQPMVATTDSNGSYSFDGLDEGTYVVEIAASEFAPGRPLSGRASSSGNDLNGTAPDPDNDLDRDDNGDFFIGGLTRSKPVTITAGDEPGVARNPTIDFGFTPAAGLGSTVFFDNNRNGIRDSGDGGVAGVTITVYDADTGAVVGLTSSDNLGQWSITGLPPGDYFAVFNDPLNRTYTVQNAGTNDSIDSDVSVAGRTQVVTLDIGEYDPTLWAGIIPGTSTTTTTTNRLAFTGTSSGDMALAALLMISTGMGFVLLERRRRSSADST